MIKTSLTGINAVNDMLADLGSVLGKKAVRAAARKAMTPVLNQARSNAPYDALTQDGIHINESIKLSVSGRTAKDRRNGTDTFLSANVKTQGKEVNQYAALVEFGRNEFIQKRTNIYGIPTKPFNVLIRATEANPFMRPALQQHANSVVDTFVSSLTQEIEKIQKSRTRIARSKIRAKERKAGKNI